MAPEDEIDAVNLPASVTVILEQVAEHVHNVWARSRVTEGWVLGEQRDHAAKTHPGLVPYAELPESEKEVDRLVAAAALKAVYALGFELRRSDTGSNC